jgi:hypothetical protein
VIGPINFTPDQSVEMRPSFPDLQPPPPLPPPFPPTYPQDFLPPIPDDYYDDGRPKQLPKGAISKQKVLYTTLAILFVTVASIAPVLLSAYMQASFTLSIFYSVSLLVPGITFILLI